MSVSRSTVPGWCRRVLNGILPRDRRDDVLGDLEEVHRRRRERFGGFPAWLMTSLDATGVALTFLVYRWREKERPFLRLYPSEVRVALRVISKQPILTLTAIVALALGIGLAVTGFTMLDAVVGSELPFTSGERFTRILFHDLDGRRSPTLEHYKLLAEAAGSFEHVGAVGAVGGGGVNLLHESGLVEPVQAGLITPDSFRFLPYLPLLGRSLVASDGAVGAAPVVLLRESLWQRRYERDPEVIGRSINVAGVARTVVGVLPDAAEFPAGGELWVPLDDRTLGGNADGPRPGVGVFAILRPDVSLEAAESELSVLAARPEAAIAPGVQTRERAGPALGASEEEVRLSIIPYTQLPGGAGAMGTVMVAVIVALVLVIASNVANLILARTSTRTGELAVRTALGASRSRLIGQLSLEGAVVGCLAALAGLGVAQLVLHRMAELLDEMPFWVDLSVNPRAVAFSGVVGLLVSCVCGVLPAFRATRRDTAPVLQTNGSYSGTTFGLGRLGSVMMICEMAISIALLSGALVMARSYVGYLATELDLPEGQVLTAQIVARSPVPGVTVDRDLPAEVAAAIRQVPGVIASSSATHLPRIDATTQLVSLVPEAGESEVEPRSAAQAGVGEEYFEVLTASALSGRLLRPADYRDGAAPVVVVNEPFVRKVLGGQNAVGRRLQLDVEGAHESPQTPYEIVGVVPDLGLSAGDPERAAGYYLPMLEGRSYFYVALRTRNHPMGLAEAVRRAVADLDPNLQVRRVAPLEEVNWDERAFHAGFAATLTAMGAMALLLSLAGVYAMISFAVVRRTREIGIRVALGASRGHILRSMVAKAGVHLGLAAVLGVVLGRLFMDSTDKMLVARLPAGEPWILPLVIGLMVVVGTGACLIPARRALRIAPTDALRFE